jgi:hypothetical protein
MDFPKKKGRTTKKVALPTKKGLEMKSSRVTSDCHKTTDMSNRNFYQGV